MITIDSITYNVPIEKWEETWPFLQKSAERSMSGFVKMESIGIFQNVSVEMDAAASPSEMVRLWAKLKEFGFHNFTIPDSSGAVVSMYVADLKRTLRSSINGADIWDSFSFSLVPEGPQATP